MPSPRDNEPAIPPSPAPRRGLQLMAIILVVMALLAVYSNVQRARRGHIETVTIAPAPPRANSPEASPTPSAP
ncbi:MAG: hypothetical protein H0T95_12940 [Chthoniobacterales bacterium]|nr:hypothetical protein [Chthoniobacterales bacterium]MBA3763762.1 hypothetical protein [Chthoniobacterales bacterium]